MDSGLSMVATAASLVIGALLLAFALTSMFKSTGGSTKLSNAPGVGTADDIAAQQALSTSLTAAGPAAAAAGGYGAITAGALETADPSIAYTSGPSTSSSSVSVASSSAGMTLAVRSSTGSCWLVWDGGSGVWYGEQTNLPSCTAPALGTAPTAGPVSSSAIGWQQGGFPGAG
jgi:hypothetical protein